MASRWLVEASVLVLAIGCFGQDAGRDKLKGDAASVFLMRKVLSNGHASGSLVYWGRGGCGSRSQRYPEIPSARATRHSGSPLEILQEMFADDPRMRVTQGPRGVVRVVETDVPTDLLDFKISHISFDVSGTAANKYHGPNMALQIILSNPEVEAFRKAHDIGPFSEGFLLPADAGSNKPSVAGSLDNVTVSQALDYVLRTFPGFWVYGNCESEGGGRRVFFWFVENTRSRQDQDDIQRGAPGG